MKTRTFFFSCLASIAIASCSDVENNNTEEIHRDTTIIKQQPTKTDEYVKAGKEVLELRKDMLENKKRKDSVRNENKARVWVYQIGGAYNSEDLAAKEVDKLADPNVYVFKKTKHEYYLIKDDGYASKEALEEAYGEVKKKIQAVSPSRIEMVDLSLECSAKTEPTESKAIRYRNNGEKKEVRCKICD